mmetsp:Transcript_30797/g.80656  ORF Transcript_30797/g.80656 Transcript_30797/m.80656 type:complete len:161 (-) Transcript_30797:320-802(-)
MSKPQFMEIQKSTGVIADVDVDQSFLPHLGARVRLAIQIDKLLSRKKKENSELSWYKRTSEQLGIPLDAEIEDQLNRGDSDEEDIRRVCTQREEANIARLEQELGGLLGQTVVPKGHSATYYSSSTKLKTLMGHTCETGEKRKIQGRIPKDRKKRKVSYF